MSKENRFIDDFNTSILPDRFGDIMFISERSLSLRLPTSTGIRAVQALAARASDVKFSHVAICLRPALWMEATPGKGVSFLDDFKVWRLLRERHKYNLEIFRPSMTDKHLTAQVVASNFAFEAYQNPYNWMFSAKREPSKPGADVIESYFCSEFVVEILKALGFFHNIDAKRVFPHELYLMCQSEGWSPLDEIHNHALLNDDCVGEFLETCGMQDDVANASIEAFLTELRKPDVNEPLQKLNRSRYSLIANLYYLRRVNLVLKKQVEDNKMVRGVVHVAGELTEILLKENRRAIYGEEFEILDEKGNVSGVMFVKREEFAFEVRNSQRMSDELRAKKKAQRIKRENDEALAMNERLRKLRLELRLEQELNQKLSEIKRKVDEILDAERTAGNRND